MPLYLLHGFRWPRGLVRIHVIINNLQEASPEWVMRPATAEALIASFHSALPGSMEKMPQLMVMEQYDPADLNTFSADFCYVADTVYRAELSMNLDEYNLHVPQVKIDALKELRAHLFAPDPRKTDPELFKIGWYIVYCGDEVREHEAPDDDTASASTMRASPSGANLAQSADSPSNGVSEAAASSTRRPDSKNAAATAAAVAATSTPSLTSASSGASSKSRGSGTLRRNFKKLLRKKSRS